MAGYNLDEKTGILAMFGGKLSAKILRENDTVDLKHYNMFEYIKATVISVSAPTIKLQINDMPQINIFPEDHLVLNYKTSGELYVISAKIDSIESLSPASINVTVIKVEKMKDLRKNVRFYVSLPSYIRAPGVWDPVFGVVTNISTEGVKVNCNLDILMEDLLDITITLDESQKLNFRGKIVRKNKLVNLFEYGIEIYEITEGNRRNLICFINEFEYENL